MPICTRELLLEAYHLMLGRFGRQHWWPGETPFEVMVGAVLTQNTNWKNVEKAISNLKERGLLTPRGLYHLSTAELGRLIRPAGYYNVKAKRLKNLVTRFVDEFDGEVSRLMSLSVEDARAFLLSINGIGEETADSIILYALERPIFVVDAYTKRILFRHSLISEDAIYSEVQGLFMDRLEPDTALFNEYHALIVRVGKEYCKNPPKCDDCPLMGWAR